MCTHLLYLIMIENEQYYLVTADNWFVAPDGDEYRGVWGKCKVVKVDEAFGFTPQRPSTNWFLYIGDGENQVILAGCQIHYAVRCKVRPICKDGLHDMPNTATDKTKINKIFFTE